MARLTWTRRYKFAAVHALHTGVRKERLHGHSYYLEITFVAPTTDAIDQLINGQILTYLHGKQLDFLPNATGECIVNWIHDRLSASDLGAYILSVSLQETRKNRFVSARTEPAYV